MRFIGKTIAAIVSSAVLITAAPTIAHERIGTERVSTQSRAAAAAPQSAIRMVSSIRQQRGLPALRHDPRLDRAAAMHARDMASRRFFSHRGSNGSRAFHRVRASGYNACYAAENIARGPSTAQQATQVWMRSSGHRKVILSRKSVAAGVAMAPGNYWVMVFARPC